jgi:hypothetical protein
MKHCYSRCKHPPLVMAEGASHLGVVSSLLFINQLLTSGTPSYILGPAYGVPRPAILLDPVMSTMPHTQFDCRSPVIRMDGIAVRRERMDDRQHDLLRMAFREAYLCLRDRNRPQVRVEGRLTPSDAELATTIRLFAQRLLTVRAERDRLVNEIEPLWEARLSGALERLLDAVEELQMAEVGGWNRHGAHPASALRESDLRILRALADGPDKEYQGT